jgi:hypothetical protein
MHQIKRPGITEEEKTQLYNELDSKILDYIDAQKNQLKNGGPGPVASEEVMAIVNEHNSEYEIITEAV